jgi:hypothetical protein
MLQVKVVQALVVIAIELDLLSIVRFTCPAQGVQSWGLWYMKLEIVIYVKRLDNPEQIREDCMPSWIRRFESVETTYDDARLS